MTTIWLTMIQAKKRMKCAALLIAMLACTAVQAAPLRIGYWTSGVSLGLGAVLETGDFLKKAGITDARFVHFAEVNAPATGLAANVIDISFSVAAASGFSIAASGVPIKIFGATAPADVTFVTQEDSPIKSMAGLRGTKMGMSPSGSSVALMTAAVLKANYGLGAGDYALVPGNEARLAQFLMQKQVDAAALRSVTVAQLTEVKTRRLGTMVEEWHKLTKSNAMPYLGVAAARAELVQNDPQTVAKFIVAVQGAISWGRAHPDQVAAILQKVANLPAADAKIYAAHWDELNSISFEPIDIDTLKREQQIFAASGAIKGTLPADVFVTEPYQSAKKMMAGAKP
ncbi:aliphatic sulfonate ABC transporter periplasmic ligand-binding protein [Caballeronia sordidicola]|uniref:Aliphatic sulfonate ABC transporter periplasmic ligand-binding protein n=1 Tax=Caballeronia sordidicola TaxID=196367 RepID=A0A158G7K2_CABSO|nr:ABC transporter substrate-binding protein [Caballeronia sordidicola]SAL27400.1 aliphatic sulfonate ABC transporter periplasmic ligand-binding protein [Caballeronia sordidicola]